MALTVGELVAYLDIDKDKWDRGLGAAWGQFRGFGTKVQTEIDKIAKNDKVQAFTDGFDRAAMAALRVANNLSNIPTAAAGITGVATIAGQLSGVLGLLPAAGAAAAQGMVAVKVGMQGFGEAMKAAGDPKKFAEALKTLSPAARETALAVQGMRGAWEEMQNSVQERLFDGVSGQIKRLGATYIPVLREELGRTAEGFNLAARETMNFLNRGEQVADVRKIMRNLSTTTTNFSRVLRPITSIMIDIVAVGSDMLAELTGGFGNAADRAAAFVKNARETGQLRQWMQTGLDTVRKLGTLFGNLASIVTTVFKGLDAGGGTLLDTLIRVTGQVRDFLQSFEGQQALQALGVMLNTISRVVTDVLIAAFKALGPVLVAIAPFVTELATVVGGALVSAIEFLGPKLESMARFLSENSDALTIAVPLVLALVAALKGVQVASKISGWLTGATGALTGLGREADKTKGKIGGGKGAGAAKGVAGALAALGGAAAALNLLPASERTTELGRKMDGVGESIMGVGGIFAFTLPGMIAVAVGALIRYRDEVSAVVDPIVGNVGGAVLRAVEAANSALNGSHGATRAASEAWAWTLEEPLQDLPWDYVAVVDEAAGNAVAALGGWADDAQTAGDAVGTAGVDGLDAGTMPAGATGWEAGRDFVSRVDSWGAGAFGAGRGLGHDVVSGAGTGSDGMGTAGWEAGGEFSGGVRGGTGNAYGAGSALGSSAADGADNHGGAARSAGSGFAASFAAGISAGIGSVAAAVTRLAQAARDRMPGSPARYGPLSGKGYSLFSGRAHAAAFAQGMSQRLGMVQTASHQLAAAATVSMPSYGMPAPDAAFIPASRNGNGGGAGGDDRALVHIDNYHPPADATPSQVAYDLAWMSKGKG